MDDDQIVKALITFIVIGLFAPATLWYLGMRFRNPQLKVWGVVLAATYVLVFGYNAGQEWFDWFPAVYRTEMAGPDQRTGEASVVVEGSYHVNVAGSRNQMKLSPVARYGERPAAPLTLGFEVRSPNGQVLAKGRETLPPSGGPNWAPLKTEFTAAEDGDHKLILDIPKPARKVRIEITERKK